MKALPILGCCYLQRPTHLSKALPLDAVAERDLGIWITLGANGIAA